MNPDMMSYEASQVGHYDPAFTQNTPAGPDPSRLWRTPSPPIFSTNVNAFSQHPRAQLEQAQSLVWRRKLDSSRRGIDGLASYHPNLAPIPDTGEWPSGFAQLPRNSVDSNSGDSTHHSQPDTIGWSTNALFVSPEEDSAPTYFTGVGSHNRLNTPMLSPDVYSQSGSSTHATGNAMGQTNGFFSLTSSCPQYSARQEQQPFGGPQSHGPYPQGHGPYPQSHGPYLQVREPYPQDHEPYPSSTIDVIEPLPHHQPTHRDGGRDVTEDHQNPSPYVCNICLISFGREADLRRHEETAKKHGPPKGPACPEPNCNHPDNFTRADNFRTHCRKQHGKTYGEAGRLISEWNARGETKSSVGDGGRVEMRRRESTAVKKGGSAW